MHDQANRLRRLVRDCAPPEPSAPSARPRFLAVTSGKGGVGTTTIAVNLAVAAAQAGHRTVLVDADPHGGDVAAVCGIEPRYTLADVLVSGRTVSEVLEPGPGPMRVLPGAWGWERRCSDLPAAGKRLLGQLDGLDGPTDLVVLDMGNRPSPAWQRCFQVADLILAVTTPATPSVLGTYASIKALTELGAAAPVHALVNLAPSPAVARDVLQRLAHACRRFLGIRLHDAGHLAADPEVAAAATRAEPPVIAAPGCDATGRFKRLARTLAACATHPPPAEREVNHQAVTTRPASCTPVLHH